MNLPACAASRNIDPAIWSALKNSIYPGAHDDSVVMVVDYCVARGLDPLLKPVHLVPMYVEDKATGQKQSRDVVMPGIGLYRIQADRSGNYAGMDAPNFGDELTLTLGSLSIKAPEWCEVTVHKLIGDRIVAFTAREYWIENYASKKRDDPTPNAMWAKRPRGQIVKCATAQALRAAWPEIGSQPTAEEMEGKELDMGEAPRATPKATPQTPPQIEYYPQEKFDKYLNQWGASIKAGKNTAATVMTMVESSGKLTEKQKEAIKAFEVSA
jgi:phage recombination protein Bet